EQTVGGQAVIEGVMMRAPEGWAVAVRTPAGNIEARSEELPRLSTRSRAARIPFVRGVLVLAESLTLGMKSLTWSAQKQAEDEEEELSSWQLASSIGIAFVFFAGVFILGPAALAGWWAGGNSIAFAVLEGVVRLVMFVGYIWLIGRMKDIKRVFQYHGAEHKTIHAYEAGEALSIENIQRHRPEHPRCGTSFLLIVLLGSIVLFTIIPQEPLWWLILSRIIFIPVIAGASYELLRFSGLRAGSALGRVLAAPGLWLQRLTTGQPDDDQVEVAIASLLVALSDEHAEAVKARGPVAPAALDVILESNG
ncbi:MAG: DUF1385 domain-containing protein, partial [Gemmatimonadota bacterium]|nr:DUF1385 domain-containing protein [Gemmatimonadota bacterium]